MRLPMPRPDSSVVERGPEKAGVGGSIPSLATIFSTTYKLISPRFHSNWHEGIRPVLKRGLAFYLYSQSLPTAQPLLFLQDSFAVFPSARRQAVPLPLTVFRTNDRPAQLP